MIYDPFTYAAVNYCSCKNPIFVRFKDPREINGQLVLGCKVPCGKCELCKKRRQREWFVRLNAEWKHSETAFFVTLTYDDAHLPCKDGIVYVSKKDCQDFMKRLRKPLGNHRISYFLVSEYGDQFKRPHYHMILFNYPLIDLESVKKSIEEAWQNGLVSVGTVTCASINYCTKYILKDENKKENCPVPCFMLSSRRPAIGSSFLSCQVTKFYKDSKKGRLGLTGATTPCHPITNVSFGLTKSEPPCTLRISKICVMTCPVCLNELVVCARYVNCKKNKLNRCVTRLEENNSSGRCVKTLLNENLK